MSDTDRLAALLHDLSPLYADGFHHIDCHDAAAVLIAAGVRVGDDGLCVECAEPSHDEDLHDHHYVNGVVHIGPPCRAAPAASPAPTPNPYYDHPDAPPWLREDPNEPAPTLDRERLARALDHHFRGIGYRHPGATWVAQQDAAAIADAYEAER